ncbi:MAG: hypothetical protein QM809_11330 [Gordonia sp. (in: high G+C Gram-positive bacteria)]|uniref:hypothetical protein n=1 Tax=Gordonia sp. (in: high G+C Gram-positive bacteria) TaxID=84139 RepID=UPI0039E3465E
MNFQEWLDALTGGDSLRTVATNTGVSHSTISRQLAKSKLDPELVIALARAYRHNEVDALVETGYVDSASVELAGIPVALGYATNAQILDEIRKRTDPEAARMFRDEGDPNVITPNFGHQAQHQVTAAKAQDTEPAIRVASKRVKEMAEDTSNVGEENQDSGDDFDPA